MPESDDITIKVRPGTIVFEPLNNAENSHDFRQARPGESYADENIMCTRRHESGSTYERYYIYTRRVVESPKPIPVPSAWVFDEGRRLVRVTMRIDGALRGWFCMDSRADGFKITEALFRSDVEHHGGYMVWPREEGP